MMPGVVFCDPNNRIRKVKKTTTDLLIGRIHTSGEIFCMPDLDLVPAW